HANDGIRELARDEWLKVLKALTDPDPINRYGAYTLTAGCYRRKGSAFGRAIQFGDDQACQTNGSVKRSYLRYCVLPCVPIDYQQDFVRRGTVGLPDDSFYFP